jgi:hypothetical protein
MPAINVKMNARNIQINMKPAKPVERVALRVLKSAKKYQYKLATQKPLGNWDRFNIRS